jgi:hypothetical protein
MAFIPPTAEELGLFLDLQEIDGNRADFLIDKAISLCQTVVKPLPDGADSVVLSVAGRAFVNPGQATYETIGPMSVQRPSGSGGLYLTKADIRYRAPTSRSTSRAASSRRARRHHRSAAISSKPGIPSSSAGLSTFPPTSHLGPGCHCAPPIR